MIFKSRIKDKALSKTLEELNLNCNKLKLISYGNTKDTISKTHKETNTLIQRCLRDDSLGSCIHITGEMRALKDPFHRYICEEMNHNEKEIFKVVYNLPKIEIGTFFDVIKSNIDGWATGGRTSNWIDDLRAIYSIANRSVNLFTYDTSNEIQYSVFGDRYILLQEKHESGAKSKATWLIESETINSTLADRAESIINGSVDVDGSDYREFSRQLNSIASKRILSLLCDGVSSTDNLLNDDIVKDYSESPIFALNAIETMGFVRKNSEGVVEITDSGKDFIL